MLNLNRAAKAGQLKDAVQSVAVFLVIIHITKVGQNGGLYWILEKHITKVGQEKGVYLQQMLHILGKTP